MNGLCDRRVLITAGAGGIGLAIAHEFATAGALVHIADQDADAIQSLPGLVDWSDRGRFSTVDVSDESAVVSMMQGQLDTFAGVDVLINCAGIKGPTGPLETLGLEELAILHGHQSGGHLLVLQACDCLAPTGR